MPDPVAEACEELLATLEIPGLVLSGSYSDGLISVAGRGPEAAPTIERWTS